MIVLCFMISAFIEVKLVSESGLDNSKLHISLAYTRVNTFIVSGNTAVWIILTIEFLFMEIAFEYDPDNHPAASFFTLPGIQIRDAEWEKTELCKIEEAA